jgi:Domain of unknown function (DUF4406)
MKLYLAGPMTGLPQFNFPAFHAAAAVLRAKGVEIVSPAELDSDAIKSEAIKSTDGKLSAEGTIGGETWGEILARDVIVIADTVDGIVFLPDWHKSRGARLEAFVALLTGKKHFYYYVAGATGAVDRSVVQQIIRENMP